LFILQVFWKKLLRQEGARPDFSFKEGQFPEQVFSEQAQRHVPEAWYSNPSLPFVPGPIYDIPVKMRPDKFVRVFLEMHVAIWLGTLIPYMHSFLAD
jgi:hypothetical protein